MTLSFVASVTLTGASSVRGACIDEINQRVLLVETTTNTFRQFALSTGTQFGSNTTITAGAFGVAMITTACAVIVGSTTTVDFIELSTGYKQSITGSLGHSLANPQIIASDLNLGIALGVCNVNRSLVKISATAPYITQLNNLAFPGSGIATSIVLKSGGGSWLVGFRGHIAEVDSNGNILDQMVVPVPNASGLAHISGTGFSFPYVFGLASSENMLAISTDCGLYAYDYSTKTFLTAYAPGNGTSVPNFTICATSSGEFLGARYDGTSTSKAIFEIDLSIAPYLQVRDYLFTDSASAIVGLGISQTSNYGYALQQTNTDKLRLFKVIPRGSTTRTITVNPGSVHAPRVRLMIIDDTGGTGTTQLVCDTIVKSPTTIRVPTGKNLIEYVKVGEGPGALFDVSRYST